MTGDVEIAVLTGAFTARPERVGDLAAVLARYVVLTRGEPGCAGFSSAIDVSDANLLHIGGEWSDEIAIDAHMRSEHMTELLKALGSAKVESIRVDAYEGHYLRTLLGEAAPAED